MISMQSLAPLSRYSVDALYGSLALSRLARRSFTIIELMVVVGIIIILVGLTVGVAVILHQKSEQRQIENALKLLDQALSEWEATAERQMSWGPVGYVPPSGGPPLNFDIDSRPNPPSGKVAAYQLKQILARLTSNPTSREILAKIDPNLFVEEADPDMPGAKRWMLRDPWGQTVVPVHPGRVPNAALYPVDNGANLTNCTLDEDGTIRTDGTPATTSADVFEKKLGICKNRRIFFICRGPDGELGNLHLEKPYAQLNNSEVADLKKTEDNLYSYPPLLTRCP